jgi:hypothetical protein
LIRLQAEILLRPALSEFERGNAVNFECNDHSAMARPQAESWYARARGDFSYRIDSETKQAIVGYVTASDARLSSRPDVTIDPIVTIDTDSYHVVDIQDGAFRERPVVSVKLPFTVKFIGADAFFACQKLRSVVFPDNSQLIRIESHAFMHSGLEAVALPKSLEAIGKCAFLGCRALVTVTFYDQSALKRIDECAFMMTAIAKIRIPKAVEYVGPDAFACCWNLKTICFEENSMLRSYDGVQIG